MNFFFSINNKKLDCSLTIPKFKNNEKINKKYILFSSQIKNNKWLIEEVTCQNNENFYFLKNLDLDNHKIFFLAKKEEVKRENIFLELQNFNNYTDTMPDFRSNMKIEIKNKGFSSYQADYPYNLSLKTGNVLSPVSTLLNRSADKNIIFFKNIYFKPVKNEFFIYFVDVNKKKILHKVKAFTNQTNQINVESELIQSQNYIFSDGYLGIPIYVCIKNDHLSMEHTHPPHLYIWGYDKFEKIEKIKKEINEIINKKVSKI
tara:strand:- start:58 stop:837 length:780 start_codon:yes stop_codon:yes gene_type:complete